jgi:uncharacterized membrane protein
MHLPFQHFVRSRPHLSLAVVIGVMVSPFLPETWPWMTRLLAAWDVAVWLYLLTLGGTMVRADHRKVEQIAARQDERSPVILVSLCIAALASLFAILTQLSALKDLPLDERVGHYVFVMLTLIGSWFLVGTLFCSHYAHLYYQAPAERRPLQFPGPALPPNYWEFLYFSFTIAVAAQTSDVVVCDRPMRQLVLGQSVLSFFFNLFILGLSINIAAGLINT